MMQQNVYLTSQGAIPCNHNLLTFMLINNISGTRKANSGKGAKKDSKEDKSNAKKKQKSTSKDTKSEIETSKSSTRLSNHSSDGMIDLHDPENAILAGTIKIKLKSITKEIIMESFDNIAAILTKD